jgi:hypothetical protein
MLQEHPSTCMHAYIHTYMHTNMHTNMHTHIHLAHLNTTLTLNRTRRVSPRLHYGFICHLAFQLLLSPLRPKPPPSVFCGGDTRLRSEATSSTEFALNKPPNCLPSFPHPHLHLKPSRAPRQDLALLFKGNKVIKPTHTYTYIYIHTHTYTYI